MNCYLKRFAFAVILISVISVNLFAADKVTTLSKTDLQKIIKLLDSNSLKLDPILYKLASFDSKKGKEWSDYFKAHPQFKKTGNQIEGITLDKEKLVINILGEKIAFSLFNNGDVQIFRGDKNVYIPYAMSRDEASLTINHKLFERENRISDINSNKCASEILLSSIVALYIFVNGTADFSCPGSCSSNLKNPESGNH